jgi:DNA polymerase V
VLESKQYQQADLFLSDSSNPILMNCLDAINHRYGQGTLTLGAEGKSKSWQMKRQFLSPQYTSNWRDIPKINC